MNENFKIIMKETFEKIYQEAKDYQNSKMLIIYILTIVMVLLALLLNFIGIE